MKYDTLLNKLTQDKKGILTTKDAVAHGVTKPSFLRFIKKNGYERDRKSTRLNSSHV